VRRSGGAYAADMFGIPTKRLLVYIFLGLLVLGVGTAAVVSMRSEDELESPIVISAGESEVTPSGAPDVTGVPDVTKATGVIGDGGPSVISSTTEQARIFVQVAGAVNRPGVYEMAPDSRVFQAVQRAGGLAPDADAEAVTLAARVSDGCRVYIPRQGEAPAGAVVPVEGQAGAAEGSAWGADTGPDGLISINSAGLDQLDALPGIGPSIAQDIITYREANGPFTSIEQLTDVPGIGPSKLEQVRPFITL